MNCEKCYGVDCVDCHEEYKVNGKDLKNIAVKALRERGFDGLFNDEIECECLNENLMPCKEPMDTCVAGYKHEEFLSDGRHFIVKEKPVMVNKNQTTFGFLKNQRIGLSDMDMIDE